MQPLTVESFCNLLTRSRLLTSEETSTQHQLWQSEAGNTAADPARFAKWLVTRQYLTEYQAGTLLRGHDRFFLDRYKLVERLGTGRMAGVYKAIHQLGQTVAIKVLPPSKARDPQTMGRFQREARLALKLKHPNVVRTFQVGNDKGLHYLVMEYLDGETLEEVLQRRGKLPPAEAVRVIHQALLGLQHLQERDIVHRDLKPGNLMLVPGRTEGQPDTTLAATVKILDVGLGRAIFDEGDPTQPGQQIELTTDGEILGSPDYMAPEQARDAHRADIRADIYALGCVLYHALTGEQPFHASNVVRIMMRHATEKPKPLKALGLDVPDRLQTTLDTMLAKDAGIRYPLPKDAAAALQEVLAAGPAVPAATAAPPPLEAYEAWLVAEEVTVADAEPRPVAPAAGGMRPHKMKILAGAGGLAACLAVAVVVVVVVAILALGRGRFGSPRTPPGSGWETAPEDEWCAKVASLQPADQVPAVAARLKRNNPGFDGQVKHVIQDDTVTELEFVSDNVTDLTPVRALPGLKRLSCAGSDAGKGKLTDLSPLAGMSLAVFDCSSTHVSDLSPLKGQPLILVGISGTQVRSLEPLQGMPLMAVHCAGTPVRDLSPLEGAPLVSLDAADTPVSDLSPLRAMPLRTVWYSLQPTRDGDLLRSLKDLEQINGAPAGEVLKTVDEQKKELADWSKKVAAQSTGQQFESVRTRLREANPGFDGQVEHKVEGKDIGELRFKSDDVSDLSPLQALPRLRRLICPGSAPGQGKVANLEPLRAMKLVELDCGSCQVSDLTPLRDMPLTHLNLSANARLQNLTPLKGKASLQYLNVADTLVSDLTPLKGLRLTYLACHATAVADLTPVKGMPLTGLSCDFQPMRDLDLVRSIKTLQKLNNKPWKEVEARQPEFEAWVQEVSRMPSGKQIEAVRADLEKRNSGAAVTIAPVTEGGVVTELKVSGDGVTDLASVRALPGLKKLTCTGSAPGKGRLVELWPLKGLLLQKLDVSNTGVHDLTPLKGAPLEYLVVANTRVSDLTPIKDLAPRDQELKHLDIRGTPVNDLEPLRGKRILNLDGSFIRDRDEDVLGSIQATRINGSPASEVWSGPRPAGQPAAVVKPRPPKVVSQLTGTIADVNTSDRTLVLVLEKSVIVQSPYHTAWIAQHQLRLLEASRIKDPVRRAHAMQHQVTRISYHQTQLYRRVEQKQKIELAASAQVNVRLPKPRAGGNQGDFSAVKRGQEVRVELARVDDFRLSKEDLAQGMTTPGDGKRIAPRLEAVTIVVLKEGP